MKLSKEEMEIIKILLKTRKPNSKTTVTITKGWNVGIS